MTKNHRPPRSDVVQIPVAIDIKQPRPFTALKDDRLATDSSEGAGCTVNTAGHQRFRAGIFALAVFKFEFGHYRLG